MTLLYLKFEHRTLLSIVQIKIMIYNMISNTFAIPFRYNQIGLCTRQ